MHTHNILAEALEQLRPVPGGGMNLVPNYPAVLVQTGPVL